ncbi:DNA topoisomerase [Clostridium botulinum]|uniref:DNA gyrase/topoisomerase IV subunit A n=1 Tax=Clostridium botulinum TaxID=1491 RepID=UPI000774B01C|nr:DNA topoisomerase (ATP-hydrolyzing) subunit A [Clostridium botulinum]MBN3352148.1 DNA topoisomerase [Clostridium botulinum]
MIVNKDISTIIEDNSMDFAQYVIKNRALPDLYSGMKPIHMKILWSMYENKTFNFTKSANVSGKVMVYSPHGDCYETIVNMVQNDRHIYNLIEGQGNWGSFCSSDMQFAASRYTECKLSKLGKDCMQGIDKNMVEMINNYDGTQKMPKFIPTRFPLILCMASNGMAVGMANNSPSFNLEEVCNATIYYLRNEPIPILYPDFATGGYILKNDTKIQKINKTGCGDITLRAKYEIKDNTILITEIPYDTKVTVESIIDKIINLCKEGKLKEINNVLNLTGINGLCIEIDCKKNTNMKKLINKLFLLTQLENKFNANMNVLVDKTPKVIGVQDTIKEWCKFRQQCVVNGINHEIETLTKELHILKGLKSILLDIDKAISIIRFSEDSNKELQKEFNIDEIQANYILNIKLININKNYIAKQLKNITEKEDKLKYLQGIVDNKEEINKIIIKDLEDVKKQFSQPRRTQIIEDNLTNITTEDLIEEYNCKIIYTHDGYIKKLNKSIPFEQHKLKDNDSIIEEISSTNKSILYLFTDKANRYKIPCYELEICSSPSKTLGEYLHNTLKLEQDEQVIKIISIEDKSKTKGYMCYVYDNGRIAKIDIESFISVNKKLQNCYNTKNRLLSIDYINDDEDVLIISQEGKGVIINTKNVNSVGSKNSQGVVGMKLSTEKKKNKSIFSTVIKKPDLNFTLETIKGKRKDYFLDDIAPTNKNNEQRSIYDYLKGNGNRNIEGKFLINTRVNNDDVIKVIIH